MKREIIQNLREDYTAASLSEHDVVKNPINRNNFV